MSKSPNRCIFCGSPNLTYEHVFSKWTHKFLEPRQKGKALAEIARKYPYRSESNVVKLLGQVRDWKVLCVCGGTHLTCNNGWMRAIEEKAKPVLLPLIKGDDTRVLPSDQRIIATWAILKAIVGEYDGRYVTNVHYKQRRYLMDHLFPPERGWGVWIGHFVRNSWVPEWVSCPFLLLPDHVISRRLSKHEATYFNSCASTQVVGKLFIHVVHSPMPRFIARLRFPTPQRGALFRIWPPSSTSIKWPSSTLGDRDADSIANAVGSLVLKVGRRRLASDASPP